MTGGGNIPKNTNKQELAQLQKQLANAAAVFSKVGAAWAHGANSSIDQQTATALQTAANRAQTLKDMLP